MNAGAASRDSGLSSWRIVRDCWATCLREQCWPGGYYRFRLYREDRRALASRFIDERIGFPLLRRIMNRQDAAILDNKLRFAEACATLGLPHVETLAVFDAGQVVEAAVELPEGLPRQDLFVKSTNLRSGWGVSRWKFDPATGHYASGSHRFTASQLLDFVGELSSGKRAVSSSPVPGAEPGIIGKFLKKEKVEDPHAPRPFIIQRAIRNHERMSAFTNGALCTVRVVTARPAGGEPQVIVATLRMPTGDLPVDNFSAGGLASPVDLESGMLGPAVYMDPRRPEVEDHPDTRQPIAGAVLPFWNEVREIALRVHRAFPNTPTVGWDVAITEDGVTLLEANSGWGFNVVQAAQGKPLGMTALPEMLMSYAR